jgi:hypothetical protein
MLSFNVISPIFDHPGAFGSFVLSETFTSKTIPAGYFFICSSSRKSGASTIFCPDFGRIETQPSAIHLACSSENPACLASHRVKASCAFRSSPVPSRSTRRLPIPKRLALIRSIGIRVIASSTRASPRRRQRRRPHGGAAPERWRRRTREALEETAQGGERSEGNADADRRQEAGVEAATQVGLELRRIRGQSSSKQREGSCEMIKGSEITTATWIMPPRCARKTLPGEAN